MVFLFISSIVLFLYGLIFTILYFTGTIGNTKINTCEKIKDPEDNSKLKKAQCRIVDDTAKVWPCYNPNGTAAEKTKTQKEQCLSALPPACSTGQSCQPTGASAASKEPCNFNTFVSTTQKLSEETLSKISFKHLVTEQQKGKLVGVEFWVSGWIEGASPNKKIKKGVLNFLTKNSNGETTELWKTPDVEYPNITRMYIPINNKEIVKDNVIELIWDPENTDHKFKCLAYKSGSTITPYIRYYVNKCT